MLVKALKDSGWFVPVEREGLQNLLTERKVVRAIESPTERGKPIIELPSLLPASLIVEGGVIAYESNVRTGGKGANYLGIGADAKYMVDQVTINLRTVDVRTSQVLASVSVTKTIYSHSISGSINTYVAWKKLLQTEGGFTSNEPGQLAIKQAIESGVVHLILQGLRYGAWNLQNQQDWFNPVLQAYAREAEALQSGMEVNPRAEIPLPRVMTEAMVLPPQKPQHMLVPYKTSEPPVAPPQPDVLPAPAAVQSGSSRRNSTGTTGAATQPKESPAKTPVAVQTVKEKSEVPSPADRALNVALTARQ
jgi:curli production assembly/transport component CsgG